MGENTVDVLVSKDGSWKVVSENIDPPSPSASKTPGFQEEKPNRSDPSRSNQSKADDCSQQISPTKNIQPSRVNSMHQNTCSCNSLAADCTNLNDQGNNVWVQLIVFFLVLIGDCTLFTHNCLSLIVSESKKHECQT